MLTAKAQTLQFKNDGLYASNSKSIMYVNNIYGIIYSKNVSAASISFKNDVTTYYKLQSGGKQKTLQEMKSTAIHKV